VNHLTNVYSVVPRLPPAIDGVGDYALNLARQLRKDFNIQTHFIVGNPTWSGKSEIEGFSVDRVIDSDAEQLTNLLSGDRPYPVLLHYVGYGYAKRGCPIWLVDGLQRWKSLYPQRSLTTMFHELYASSNLPWTSTFWLSPLQKNLVARLAKLSDRCITSMQSYARSLQNLVPTRNLEVSSLPVFSNIGELDYVSPLLERTRRLVTFGHKNSRIQIYGDYLTDLQEICESLDIEEIYDVGNPTGLVLSHIGNIPVIEKGITESSEISNILKDSIVGFLKFPPPAHLGKSTIFAAYCSHGLIPCMVSASTTSIDGLEVDKHYFSTSNTNSRLSLKSAQEIANNAYNWYELHNLSHQAINFVDNLNFSKLKKLY